MVKTMFQHGRPMIRRNREVPHMIKTLRRQGNGQVLPLDKAIVDGHGDHA
jgi:hypothetical protein